MSNGGPPHRFSFAGYSAPTWLSKNKDDVKLIITAAAGVITYFVASIHPPELNAALAAVAAAGTKFVVDAVDYWLTATPT